MFRMLIAQTIDMGDPEVRVNSVHRYVGCLAAVLASPDNNLKRLKICGGCESDVQVFGGYGFGGRVLKMRQLHGFWWKQFRGRRHVLEACET